MVDGWVEFGLCARLNGGVVFGPQWVCRYAIVRLNTFVVGRRGALNALGVA